jgi:hypothetical protein
MDIIDFNDIDTYIEKLIEAQEQEINDMYDRYYPGN